jgi:uncharacterized protein YyaL (SSP411 family)
MPPGFTAFRWTNSWKHSNKQLTRRRQPHQLHNHAVNTCAFSQPSEIAIVGDPDAANTQALLSVVRSGYRPSQVVALGAPDAQPPAVPLLQDRGLVEGHAAAYVCRDFTCQAPVTKPEGLRAQLEQRRRIVSES